MKAKVVLGFVGARKNGVKTYVVQEYFFTHPRIKLWRRCL